jgi:membrane fusion protein (multidrug efflux system)
MRPVTRRGLWAAFVVIAVGGIVVPRLRSSGPGEAGGGRGGGGAGQDTALVTVDVPTPSPLADVVLTTGTLLPNEEVRLVAEASGRITHLTFAEGSTVRPGQLLVKINDADLRAQLDRTRQRIALAETAEGRRRKLLEIGGVSREEYDQSLNELNVLRAEQRLIEAQIERTEIRAPFGGVVGLRAVSPGSYLSPQSPVATLQQVDPIKLDFDVPERYAGMVRIGGVVSFTAEGMPGTHQATIYAVEPGISESTRTLRVRARGSNGEGLLRPGGFAEVEMTLSSIPDALSVPTSALTLTSSGASLFLVRGGKAEPRPVRTGLRTGERVQVVSGIAAGDTVVVSGVQQLRPGAPVRVAGDDGFAVEAIRPQAGVVENRP